MCSAPLVSTGGKHSSHSGLQTLSRTTDKIYLLRLKSCRKFKYLRVWTKCRALNHHIQPAPGRIGRLLTHSALQRPKHLHKYRQQAALFLNSISNAFFKIYLRRDRGLYSLHPLLIFKHGNGSERNIHHINKDNLLRQHA